MKTKVLLAIVCVLALLTGVLSGCGTAKSTEATGSTVTASENSPNVDASKTGDNEHYKFSMVTVEKTGIDTNEIYKALSQKFNLEFDIIQLSHDTWNEKVKIMFASGEIPDVVQANVGNLSEIKKYQKQGTIHEIPDLSQYPNLAKLVEQNQAEWDVNKIDGKNYHWPRWNYRNDRGVSFGAAFYRMDWAKKLGYNYEQIQVLTMDEMYKLAADFAKKDPGGNGTGKTIGLAFDQNGHSELLSSVIFPYNANADKYIKEDGKYVWGAAQPATLEGIKAMKAAFDTGAIDKDFYARTNSDNQNYWPAGKIGIYFFNIRVTSYVQNMVSQFKANDSGFDFTKNVGILIPTGTDGKVWLQGEGGSWSEVYFSSKLNDAQIDRLFKYMDYTMSEEGMKLCLYGLKDIDYKEENGKIISLAKVDAQGNTEKTYLDGGRAWKWPVIFGKYDYDTNPNVSDEIKDLYNKAEAKIFSLPAQEAPKDWAYHMFSGLNKDKFGTFRNEIISKIQEVVVSSKDVESDWNKWLGEMQPKVDPVLKEINDGIK